MRTDLKEKLLKAVEASKIRQEATQKAEAIKANAEQEFIDQFQTTRADIIKPAMEELKSILATHGVVCDIHESEEQYESGTGRRIERCGITISFRGDEKAWRRPDEYPHFAAHADRHSKTVYFHESTIGPGRGGSSGGCGQAKIEDITQESIQEYITNLAAKVI